MAVKKISGVEANEGVPSDPYAKWAAYEEIYILSDESKNALDSGGHKKGALRTNSGLEIKVMRYTRELLQTDPALRDKIEQSIKVGTVGFGALDQMNNQRSVQFHSDIAKKIGGMRVVVANAQNDESLIADTQGLSDETIAEISQLILKEIGAAASGIAEKLAEEVPGEKEVSSDAKAEAAPAARAAPKARVAPKAAGTAARRSDAVLAAEQMMNQKIHQAEHHRTEKQRKKREAEKERKEEIIKHETIKHEIHQADIKKDTIKQEEKRK